MLTDIPQSRPNTPLLDTIASPRDIQGLSTDRLNILANELREYLLFSVGQTGGHFGAGLGVIELTIALHYVLDTPNDDLIWDVGHQAYPHKILTGRRDALASVRQQHGLAPFPSIAESKYDAFGVGHSSTSISAALGMALAKQHQDISSHSVAVIGDGAMTAGMAFEAINHAAHCEAPMLIVLNDNTMSISANIGGLASHLERIWRKKLATETEAPSLPTANLFDDLGLHYSGPVDGHDIKAIIQKLKKCLNKKGPSLLHVQTQKGYGFAPAIDDPVAYHALTKIEGAAKTLTETKPTQGPKYQNIFGTWLCQKAEQDTRTVAITPAMREGSGLVEFAQRFPERFYDVAIAEQHAVTFAAGLACRNIKPVVAIYSTFLQRAYDQLIHDVALQNLDVLFAIDRAGIVGEDGPTHHGSFDISFLRCIPNMALAAPSDGEECSALLEAAYQYPGPAAVRYPRGHSLKPKSISNTPSPEIGKSKVLRSGNTTCVLNFGGLLHQIEPIAESLDFTLIDMRWIKPLDTPQLEHLAATHRYFISIEDGCISGGAGSAVSEFFQANHLYKPILQLGIPDAFVEHGHRDELLKNIELDTTRLNRRIQHWLTQVASIHE